MNKKILSLLIVATVFLASCGNKTEKSESNLQTDSVTQTINTEGNLYDKAGIIKVKDPLASLVGYRKTGEDFFEISLDDIGKYSGHVCAGIASSFLLTKQALEMLYPNGEIPVRGQIRVAGQSGGEQLDIASYITGARAFYGRQEINSNDLIIDKSLQGEKKTFTLIFKRKDNGKMVKAVFSKKKLFEPKMMKVMIPLKEKVENGTATNDEKKLFAEKVQVVVKKAITNMPEGAITISECTEYIFPEK
ncbi:MAG: hypothetical protein KAT68_14705 [Bacteroidales bacterium]|nr:hypothetical protein [Bacteroidales bacterium]